MKARGVSFTTPNMRWKYFAKAFTKKKINRASLLIMTFQYIANLMISKFCKVTLI